MWATLGGDEPVGMRETLDRRGLDLLVRVGGLGLVLTYAVGWGLHYLYLPDLDHTGHTASTTHHGGPQPPPTLDPLTHYLTDATLAAPFVVDLLLVTTLAVRRILAGRGVAADSGHAKLIFAGAVAITAAAGSVPLVLVHGWLFDEHTSGMPFSAHIAGVALATLRYTFAITLGLALLFGVPWRGLDRPLKTRELVS